MALQTTLLLGPAGWVPGCGVQVGGALGTHPHPTASPLCTPSTQERPARNGSRGGLQPLPETGEAFLDQAVPAETWWDAHHPTSPQAAAWGTDQGHTAPRAAQPGLQQDNGQGTALWSTGSAGWGSYITCPGLQWWKSHSNPWQSSLGICSQWGQPPRLLAH